MNLATAVAEGFLGKEIELKKVLELTCEFLGRKLSRKEFNQIVRAYKKASERLAFYGEKSC